MSLTMTGQESFLKGAIYTFLNDKEKAVSAFEQARPIAEKALRESPDDASRHVTLGLILAGLGEKNAAIAEGKRAVELSARISRRLRRAKDGRFISLKSMPGQAKTTKPFSFSTVR